MRSLIESLDQRFASLNERAVELVNSTPEDYLFVSPIRSNALIDRWTVAENIVRSSAAIELAFGGITTKMWDDPLEWTLPDQLDSKERMLRYFAEVAEIHSKGITFLDDDLVLSRSIPAPRLMKTIFEILLDSIANAESHLGRAELLRKVITECSTPVS